MDTSLPKGWNSSKVEVLAELVRGITYKKEIKLGDTINCKYKKPELNNTRLAQDRM